MINKQLNEILHECLDDKILEINIIEIIESFVIEKHYYFRFKDYEKGDLHQGIISKSFRRKFHYKIMYSRKKYSKKVWKNIRFSPYNRLILDPEDIKFSEKKIKHRCLNRHTLNNGYFLYKRNQNILDRLYYINFLSSFTKDFMNSR